MLELVNLPLVKSTKVQTLSAVALHAITACTEDARLKYCWLRSTLLGYSQEVVICLVLRVSGSCIYAHLHVHVSLIQTGVRHMQLHSLPTCNGRLRRGRYVYEKLQRDKMAEVYGRQEML